jgi:hypothetical protein
MKMLGLREYQRMLQREVLAYPSATSLYVQSLAAQSQNPNPTTAIGPASSSLLPLQIPPQTVPMPPLSPFHARAALEIHGHEKLTLSLRRAHTEYGCVEIAIVSIVY